MTQFGYTSESSSPARRRLFEAGEQFEDQSRPVAPMPPAEQRRRRMLARLEAAYRATRPRTIARIAIEVAAKHRVPVEALKANNRAKHVYLARQEAYWRCRNETPHSFPVIGRWFRRDHTSVLHGVRMHEERLERAQRGLS